MAAAVCERIGQRVRRLAGTGLWRDQPRESALAVYDAIVAAGRPHGLRHAGYRAIESLRLEKGYRIWSKDITPTDTPAVSE